MNRYRDEDQGWRRQAAPGPEYDDTGPHGGAGPQRGRDEHAMEPGRYAERPYTHRSPDYNFDPRGEGEYGYSAARGSMVSPGWDKDRDDMPHGASRGEFGGGPYAQSGRGREGGAGPAVGYGRTGPRYAGGDFGRGYQTPGRQRFDSDDAESTERMRRWSGDRSAHQYEAYGPYGGGPRVDEGRSGYRSSWGASRSELGQRPSFRGHGPQGYERSDARLTEDICERMTEDPDIDPREVRVQVESGVVTLEGRVDDRWMKHHIEDLVDACSGVKDIHNRIRVGARSLTAGESGERTVKPAEQAGTNAKATGGKQTGGGSRNRH